MDNYFYNMVDPEEMKTLEYIPTIPEFLKFIRKQYSQYPAISNKVTTYTYEELDSKDTYIDMLSLFDSNSNMSYNLYQFKNFLLDDASIEM